MVRPERMITVSPKTLLLHSKRMMAPDMARSELVQKTGSE